jgi:hypothetical protein
VWVNSATIALIVLVVCVAAALGIGKHRWESDSQEIDLRLVDARSPNAARPYVYEDTSGLPDPVRRYFRAVLKEGQPAVAAARLSHNGYFNMDDGRNHWKRFTSTQLIVTRRPGFHWTARISMVPGLHVFVRDGYIAEKGILHAKLLGLLTVAELGETPEIAQGELMRFLAEAVWYPTLLLPGHGVRWQPIDESSARATLEDGANTVSLDFSFDDEGLITTVQAQERFRIVDGKFVPTQWEGKFSAYTWRDGMRIPMEGEVAWLLADGPHPYWRGSLSSVSYEWAE